MPTLSRKEKARKDGAPRFPGPGKQNGDGRMGHPPEAEREMWFNRQRENYRRIEGINDESGNILAGIALGKITSFALGRAIGALGSLLGKSAGETGAGVEEILAEAASAGPKQVIKASSRAAAEEAAEKWVGEGARPITDNFGGSGRVVGKISANGTKVARFTSVDKAEPYINLVNRATGGNLHVRF